MTFFEEHGTKLLGGTTAFLGALATLISTGAFKELLEPAAIGWLNIFVSLSTATVGGMTVARGFNNSSQVKIAAAMETAINATPGQGGFARPLVLALLLAVAAITLAGLAACVTPPHKVIEVACTPGTKYSVERCVKGIAETWETYQIRAEIIVDDPMTPADVKTGVQRAEAASRPVVMDTLKAGAVYADIKQQLAAGTTTAEQLAIANASLESWVAKALPLIRSFGAKLER